MKTLTDHTKYTQLQGAMKCMLKAGQFRSEAFQDAWQQSEAIKNQHGGLPPLPDEEADEMEACEQANERGLR